MSDVVPFITIIIIIIIIIVIVPSFLFLKDGLPNLVVTCTIKDKRLPGHGFIESDLTSFHNPVSFQV
jgi:hypothetical protein